MEGKYEYDSFFLPATIGELFVSLYKPKISNIKEILLFIHPFGEEMNKSRRMISLQARRLARNGIAVFMVDMYGCGDSSGELKDASWEIWLNDLKVCYQWIYENISKNIGLWAMRLGAVLALDFAQNNDINLTRILFWKPVFEGKIFLNEFLRVSLAANMMKEGSNKKNRQDIEKSLLSGKIVELAGYEFNVELYQEIESANYSDYTRQDVKIIWIEIVRTSNIVNAINKKIQSRWNEIDIDFTYASTICEPFWSTVEITECASLLDATCSCLQIET